MVGNWKQCFSRHTEPVATTSPQIADTWGELATPSQEKDKLRVLGVISGRKKEWRHVGSIMMMKNISHEEFIFDHCNFSKNQVLVVIVVITKRVPRVSLLFMMGGGGGVEDATNKSQHDFFFTSINYIRRCDFQDFGLLNWLSLLWVRGLLELIQYGNSEPYGRETVW
jgi:hypothetical protein